MDFGFGDDQELLRSTTRRFLTEHQSLAEVRRSLEEADLFDAGLWRQGAELGWTAMLIPADYEGGSVTEQPLVDLIVLAEELGRELNPGPFVPCNVLADAVATFGTEAQCKEHLPRLARGEATGAWCLSGDGSPEPSAIEVRATTSPGQLHRPSDVLQRRSEGRRATPPTACPPICRRRGSASSYASAARPDPTIQLPSLRTRNRPRPKPPR